MWLDCYKLPGPALRPLIRAEAVLRYIIPCRKLKSASRFYMTTKTTTIMAATSPKLADESGSSKKNKKSLLSSKLSGSKLKKSPKPDQKKVLHDLASSASSCQYAAVVAIDFGTTYSGYAYALSAEQSANVRVMDPRYLGVKSSYSPAQQPTVLLLNEDEEFHSFGSEAQEFYRDLDEEECLRWLYFEKFKMELHTREVKKSFTDYYYCHFY